jgi:ATP-dependent DNA helicase PIF1
LGIVGEYLPDGKARIFVEAMVDFSDEQKHTYDLALNTTENICVLGVAGTGKSRVIRALCESEATVLVLAFTGLAANNVNGKTIDSVIYNNMDLSKFDFIIIDEISFVSYQKLSHLLTRGVRRLVVFGDYIQLPPILSQEYILDPHSTRYIKQQEEAKKNFTGRDTVTGGLFSFEHPIFDNMHVVKLTKIFRQPKSEQLFRDVLSLMRLGKRFSKLVHHFLDSRHHEYEMLSTRDRQSMTHLFFRVSDVEKYNTTIFHSLCGRQQSYTTHFEWIFTDVTLFDDDVLKKHQKHISRGYPSSKSFKIGQMVMVTKNLGPGVFNGLMGKVSDLTPNIVTIVCQNTKMYIYTTTVYKTVTVCNVNGMPRDLEATLSFMPLMGCNAMSIHKSQGLTFDKVVIFLDHCYASSLAYVAMSRCRTSAGLFIGRKLEWFRYLNIDDVCLKYEETVSATSTNNRYQAAKICVCGKFYHSVWPGYRCCFQKY